MGLSEAFFVLFVLVGAAPDTCSEKTTEITCGFGCVWSNTTGASCEGTAIGSCGGMPSCAAADNAKCGGTAGCTWVDVVPAKCEGDSQCSIQTTSTSCGGAYGLGGCSWAVTTPGTCSGIPTICGTTESGCKITGCSWTMARDATCTGSITRCNPSLTQSVCEAIDGCEYEEVLEGCRYDDVFDCNSFLPSCPSGCTYTAETGECTGDSVLSNCGDVSDLSMCTDDIGCARSRRQECTGTPTSLSCSGKSSQYVCEMYGCSWSNALNDCVGTPLRTRCREYLAYGKYVCEEIGCTFLDEQVCVGTVSYAQCSEIQNGSQCLALGCTGMTLAQCSGIPDGGEFNTTVSEDKCDALGDPRLKWYHHSTSCENSSLIFPETTQCEEFVSNEDSCGSAGCTYTSAVLGECSGKPANSPDVGCGDSPVKDNKVNCESNKCIWTEGTGTCSGTSSDVCSSFTQSRCDLITGCTYTAEVAAHCVGTVSATACTDSTAEDVCASINGCIWNVNSCSSLAEDMCTGTCAWNQPGTCTAESRAASFIYVPEMLALFLLVLLL